MEPTIKREEHVYMKLLIIMEPIELTILKEDGVGIEPSYFIVGLNNETVKSQNQSKTNSMKSLVWVHLDLTKFCI